MLSLHVCQSLMLIEVDVVFLAVVGIQIDVNPLALRESAAVSVSSHNLE